VSPGYPGNYPHNRDETFTLVAAEGKTIQVTFKNLDTEFNVKCAYDFVMAKDGDGTELMA
jgi:cubilin